MKIADRIDRLEKAMTLHLEESGEIRTDIRWLKKAAYFLIGSPVLSEVLHHLWK
jgi:hypothetical protein